MADNDRHTPRLSLKQSPEKPRLSVLPRLRITWGVAADLLLRDNPEEQRRPVMNEPIPGQANPEIEHVFFPQSLQDHLNLTYHRSIMRQGMLAGRMRLEDSFCRLQDIIQNADQTGRRALFHTSIDAGQGANGHAVAMMYDPEKKVLHYQDPYGDDVPLYLRNLLANLDKGIRIDNKKIHQQRDANSCAYITNLNLLCWAHGETLHKNIDIEKLRRNTHALLDKVVSGHVQDLLWER